MIIFIHGQQDETTSVVTYESCQCVKLGSPVDDHTTKTLMGRSEAMIIRINEWSYVTDYVTNCNS